MRKEDLPAYQCFNPNDFIQLKNRKVCGLIIDKESINGKPTYIIVLEPDLEFENLSESSKDIINKFVITDSEQRSRYDLPGRFVLLVPIDKAFWFTLADKDSVKKMLKK